MLNPAEFSMAAPNRGKYTLDDDQCIFATCTGTKPETSAAITNVRYGIIATFYNDTDYSAGALSGTPIEEKVIPAIDLTNYAPAGQQTNWSAKFEGWINISQESDYRFDISTKDGLSVSIDGNKIIDHLILQPVTTYPMTAHLTAGWHKIEIEHFAASDQERLNFTRWANIHSSELVAEPYLAVSEPTEESNLQGTCSWTDKEIMPEELKLMTFKCGAVSQVPDVRNWTAGTGPCSNDASGCDFYQCYYANKSSGKCYCEDITCVIDKWTSEMDKCVHKAGCPGPSSPDYPPICKNGQECYTLFTHGGWYVRIPFTYTFKYDANVSLPVDFMNSTTFTEKLLSKEIKLESRTSSYTGGPVKVSIFVQKQPLRSGEESFGRISVVNNGKGNITSVNMALFVPYGYDKGGMKGMKLTMVPTEISKSANIVECTNPAFPSIGGIRYFVTSCTATEIEPDKIASYAFSFKYDISDPTVEKKSAIFFGDAAYEYKTAADTDLTIAKAPIGQ